MIRFRSERAARQSLIAAGTALLAAILVLFRAGTVPITQPRDGVTPFSVGRDSDAVRDQADADAIEPIVASDLFASDRQAPAAPYRLGTVEAPTARVAPANASVILLLGTVVRSNGRSFALCQVDGGETRMVFPGQVVGGWELTSVAQGSADFRHQDGRRLQLRVARTEQ